MPAIDIRGVYPPIPTPFLNSGEIAFDELETNVQKWSRTGLHGFVALGSNGEYVYLSREEKIQVVETVVRAAPGNLPVIAGTGCESTRETLDLTQACAAAGARAALVITPHYYGVRMSETALSAYYKTVADHSPIPILLYNVPKFTHVVISVELVVHLSRHPNIIGIKDSSGGVDRLGVFVDRCEPGFRVLVGTAGAFFAGLALGCAGGILALANLAPSACLDIYHHVQAGRIEDARRVQLGMLPVNQAVTERFGVPGLKAALDMTGYFGGRPRPPLLPSTEPERAAIRRVLTAAGLTDG